MPGDPRRHREGYVAVNRVGLHYLEWGDCGPHVLVLHGATSIAINHARFIETLFGNRHVFVPDHRGHGYSSRASSYDLDEFAWLRLVHRSSSTARIPVYAARQVAMRISPSQFSTGWVTSASLYCSGIARSGISSRS